MVAPTFGDFGDGGKIGAVALLGDKSDPDFTPLPISTT